MTEKLKKKEKNSLKSEISPSFHIEADGAGAFLSLLVSGTLGIGEFSDEEIKLITKRESIKISGKCIKIAVFEQKTVEITGKIEKIEFFSKKRRGEKK